MIDVISSEIDHSKHIVSSLFTLRLLYDVADEINIFPVISLEYLCSSN